MREKSSKNDAEVAVPSSSGSGAESAVLASTGFQGEVPMSTLNGMPEMDPKLGTTSDPAHQSAPNQHGMGTT